MAIFQYASFPNSRNRYRTATVNANTDQVALQILSGNLTLVQPSDPNRTYLLLTNLSDQYSFFYFYCLTAPGVDPSAVAVNGVPSQLLYNPTGNLLYQKQDVGLTTNWILVNPEDVGEVVQPLQTAGLESLGDVYAITNDGVTAITIAYDAGRG